VKNSHNCRRGKLQKNAWINAYHHKSMLYCGSLGRREICTSSEADSMTAATVTAATAT
jgi:hypothetical protein